jgi:hypothetical protein
MAGHTGHCRLLWQQARLLLLLLLLWYRRRGVLTGMGRAKRGAAALAAGGLQQELLGSRRGRRRAALLLARDRLRGRRGRLRDVPVVQLPGSRRAGAPRHQAQPRQLAGGPHLMSGSKEVKELTVHITFCVLPAHKLAGQILLAVRRLTPK